MKFVGCHCEGVLPLADRLYAFPRRPEGVGLAQGVVILDSGAYGLSRRGQLIGPAHMEKLNRYYSEYGAGCWCVGPDAYLNPAATMKNWRYWHAAGYAPVMPVIQFLRAGRLDVTSALRQAAFYAAWSPARVAISNPGLTAAAAKAMGMGFICAEVRRITGCQWLHNLGAGWSPADVADWRDMGSFDSIDTIAYYTDAQAGWRWRLDGRRERAAGDDDWRDLAAENAAVAARIAGDAMFGGRY